MSNFERIAVGKPTAILLLAEMSCERRLFFPPTTRVDQISKMKRKAELMLLMSVMGTNPRLATSRLVDTMRT